MPRHFEGPFTSKMYYIYATSWDATSARRSALEPIRPEPVGGVWALDDLHSISLLVFEKYSTEFVAFSSP